MREVLNDKEGSLQERQLWLAGWGWRWVGEAAGTTQDSYINQLL